MSNMTINEIRKGIKAIGEARTRLVDKVQLIALAVIRHAHEHGDVTLASELCLAVGAGMKHEALRLYLADFGPMNPNSDKEAKSKAPMVYAKAKRLEGEALEAKMALAATTAWHSYKTEKPAEAWSFAADLHKLLKRLDSAEGVELTDEEREVAAMLREAAQRVPKPVKAKKQATKEEV